MTDLIFFEGTVIPKLVSIFTLGAIILKNVFVLFTHPNYESSRVSDRMIKTAITLPNVTVRNVYELYPDFNIDIVEEQEILFGHEVIICQHPFYWYSCPPLMKQWIDVVLQYNWASDALSILGKRKYTLHRKSQNFIKYNEQSLRRLAKQKVNSEEYISKAREEISMQESLLKEDQYLPTNFSEEESPWDNQQMFKDAASRSAK